MLRLIILVVVMVLVLSFFGVSIRAIVESPTGHDNVNFVWQIVQNGWDLVVNGWHSFVAWITAFTKPIRFSL
ncbi:MAG: hypothetical protein AAB883_03325 [Patescibacteria group bacterium]